jgi:hypothetical protein
MIIFAARPMKDLNNRNERGTSPISAPGCRTTPIGWARDGLAFTQTLAYANSDALSYL